MATIIIRLPPPLVKWCVETFRPMMKINFEPSESQIVTHALRQFRANWENMEYEIPEKYTDYKYKRS